MCLHPPPLHTFIVVVGADSDNSEANISVLIGADFVDTLGEDGLVIIDVADENAHVRRVCGSDKWEIKTEIRLLLFCHPEPAHPRGFVSEDARGQM